MANYAIHSVQGTNRRQFVDSLELVRQGLVRPVISAELPMERAADAHRLAEKAAPTGRILLKPKLTA